MPTTIVKMSPSKTEIVVTASSTITLDAGGNRDCELVRLVFESTAARTAIGGHVPAGTRIAAKCSDGATNAVSVTVLGVPYA